jgi:hypothetical protein
MRKSNVYVRRTDKHCAGPLYAVKGEFLDLSTGERSIAPGSALDGEAHSRETVHALNLLHQDNAVTQYFTRN